jgi:hypothetical protein
MPMRLDLAPQLEALRSGEVQTWIRQAELQVRFAEHAKGDQAKSIASLTYTRLRAGLLVVRSSLDYNLLERP